MSSTRPRVGMLPISGTEQKISPREHSIASVPALQTSSSSSSDLEPKNMTFAFLQLEATVEMAEKNSTGETAGVGMVTQHQICDHEQPKNFPNIVTTACLNLNNDDNRNQDHEHDPDTEMVDENAATNDVIAPNLNSNSFQQDSRPVHNSGIAVSALNLLKRKLLSKYRLEYLKKSRLQVSPDTSLPSTSSFHIPSFKRRRSRFVTAIPVQLGANFEVAEKTPTNEAPMQTMVSVSHERQLQGHGKIQNVEMSSSVNLQDDIQKKDSGRGLYEHVNRYPDLSSWFVNVKKEPISGHGLDEYVKRCLNLSSWFVNVKKEPTSDDDDDDEEQQVLDSVVNIEKVKRENIYPCLDNGTQQQNLGNAPDTEIACGDAVAEDLDEDEDEDEDDDDDDDEQQVFDSVVNIEKVKRENIYPCLDNGTEQQNLGNAPDTEIACGDAVAEDLDDDEDEDEDDDDDDDEQQVFDSVVNIEKVKRENIYPCLDNGTEQQNLGNAPDTEIACGDAVAEDLDDDEDEDDDDDDEQQVFDSVVNIEKVKRENIYPCLDNGTQQQNLGNAPDTEIACGDAVAEDLDDDEDEDEDDDDDEQQVLDSVVNIEKVKRENIYPCLDNGTEQQNLGNAPDTEIAGGDAVAEDLDDDEDEDEEDDDEQQVFDSVVNIETDKRENIYPCLDNGTEQQNLGNAPDIEVPGRDAVAEDLDDDEDEDEDEEDDDDDDEQQVFDSVVNIEKVKRENIYPCLDNGTEQQNLGNAPDTEIAGGDAVAEDLDDDEDEDDDDDEQQVFDSVVNIETDKRENIYPCLDNGTEQQNLGNAPDIEIAGGDAVAEDLDDDEDEDAECDISDDDFYEEQDPTSAPVAEVNRTETNFPLSGINNQRSEITENPYPSGYGMLHPHGGRNMTAEVQQTKPLIILNATAYRSPSMSRDETVLFVNTCFRSLLSQPCSQRKRTALLSLYNKSKILLQNYSSSNES